ncbi:unnamed protein product [Closterium sp. NIES-53]
MYALADITEGDCYLCVPPNPGTVAAALGASVAAALGASASAAPGAGTSPPSGTAPTESFHTFTLDSGASRSFFRDSTTLTPLRRPVAVSLADPSGGPVLAHSSTVLPCPAALSGLLSGLHLPSFSTNLVSGDDLQDAWVDQFTPGGQRVTHYTCSRTGRHLATFTPRPGSSLYTLTTAPPPVPASGQVATSSQVFAAVSRSSLTSAPCSCRPLAHETLLWHHRLGHSSVPRLRGMASRALVSGLPGPHYRLGEVTEVLIDWIRCARRQLSESFGSDLPVLRLHSDRGGEFSSDLLRAFCRLEGIRQTFTLPASPQQNGIAERRIGMFYHPTSRRVLSSQDVTFDESVLYYRLFPYRTASPPPPPLFLAPDPAEPVEVAVDSGAARGAGRAGAGTGGAETGGAESGGAESGGAETGRAEPGGVAPEGTVSGGAEPARVESGGALGVPSRREPLSPQRLHEWYSRRSRVAAGGATGAGVAGGAAGAGGATGATGGAGAAGGGAGVGAAGGAAGAGAAGATGGVAGAGGTPGATGGAGAAGVGAGAGAARGAAGVGAAGGAAGTGDPEAEGTGSVSAVSGGAVRPRPCYVPLLQQLLGSPPSPGPPPPSLSPLPVPSQSQLQPASPLPGPSPYSGPTRCLTERREPESRPVSRASRSTSPVRSVRAGRVSRPRLPPVPGSHSMTVRPSTAPQRVPLPSPPASSLPDGPDPKSDALRAASPTVTRFLATAVTDPLFESSATSALVADSASSSVCPPSVGGECALGTDFLEDRQEDLECFAAASPHLVSMLLAPDGDRDALDIPTPRSYAEAIEGPYSQWQATMDAEMASWKSTGTYVDEVPPPGANIVSGMWIFRVKRPPGSPPAFKARYVARGFSQRQGVDFFQTFSPTPKMTTLRVLLHVAAQRDYELRSLDFSTPFLQGSLHEEIWLRRPPGFTGSFPAGTQWSLRRPVYGLRQAPRDFSSLASSISATPLCWLTYLLTDLGEAPRSPPVPYVDNKAMLALCQEHRLEHRTKHIALRYFLARELQQRGQLRLAYVASQANTADVFTKALQPCDHQRFCTVLGLVPTVPHLLTS